MPAARPPPMNQMQTSRARLSSSTLADAEPTVAKPGYDRSGLGTGIVHLGLGAFHRAHQALYTEAAVAGGDRRWGIVGVSLRDARIARHARRPGPSVLGHRTSRRRGPARASSACCTTPARTDRAAQGGRRDRRPGVAVVTSTVTEKGYSQNPATADLDGRRRRHPPRPLASRHAEDARSACWPPASAGALRGAPLTHRLLRQHGEQRRHAAQAAGAVRGPARPGAGAAHRARHRAAELHGRPHRAGRDAASRWTGPRQRLGLRDEAAIVCEPFTQWVIEDRFAGPRPAWEDAGALLTSDVRPYQAMKLRLLNGTHSAIAYAGQLCGLESVSDAMADPLVGAFARAT